MHILVGILIFKGLTARRLYKSFGVKGLTNNPQAKITEERRNCQDLTFEIKQQNIIIIIIMIIPLILSVAVAIPSHPILA
jgi:hypothetical protein